MRKNLQLVGSPGPVGLPVVFFAVCLVFAVLWTGDLAGAESSLAKRAQHPFSHAHVQIPKDARYCSFSGHAHELGRELPLTVTEGMTVSAQRTLISRIQDYSGVKTKFDLYSGQALNAAAVLFKSEQNPDLLRRAIVFQPYFLSYLDQRTRLAGQHSDWARLSVFAHEVGHHLAGHTLSPENQRYHELQADWYSGFILGKMGADEASAQIVLKTFGFRASHTHPGSDDRLAAVSDGWRQAKCELGERRDCERRQSGVTRDDLERIKRAEVEERKLEQSREKVAPRLMCQIGGEPIALGQNNMIYWLRHYETKMQVVAKAYSPAQSPAKPVAGSCAKPLQATIAEGLTLALCDDEQRESSPARVFSSADGAPVAGLTGVCERCTDKKDALCPKAL